MIQYDSPAAIKTFLETRGLATSKRFGQNFLVDPNEREKLYAALGLSSPAHVWEIGPGIGAMTALILERGHRLTAFEIDYGFSRVLRELFGENRRFRLIEGDFLKTWKTARGGGPPQGDALWSEPPDIIFGNLPYSAALAIIADLLERGGTPPRMVFTVQKEAALRIAARPGTKDYSAVSVLCSSVCRPKILYDIGASAFWPQPRVLSSVVALEARADPIAAADRAGFSRFVRGAFASRRKTLSNNLKALDPRLAAGLGDALSRLGLSSDLRAEALGPEELAAVYFALAAPRG